MSAITVTMTGGVVARSGSRAVGVLARREAYRIGAHPVGVVLLLYFLVLGGAQAASDGLAAWDAVHHVLLIVGLLWFGPATFFVTNLVASSARRSNAESQLAAAPLSASARTLAACLGVLGPTAVATGFAAVLWLVEHAGASVSRVQGVAELAVIPLCTLGGGLLGAAVARWFPWRGLPLVVLFALIAWVVAVTEHGALWWTAPWTMSPAYYQTYTMGAGSHAWHAVYLFGLALLAGVAALLRHRPHRRLLLVLAAVAWIATIAACWAQLP
jgi:hypothetical protein